MSFQPHVQHDLCWMDSTSILCEHAAVQEPPSWTAAFFFTRSQALPENAFPKLRFAIHSPLQLVPAKQSFGMCVPRQSMGTREGLFLQSDQLVLGKGLDFQIFELNLLGDGVGMQLQTNRPF